MTMLFSPPTLTTTHFTTTSSSPKPQIHLRNQLSVSMFTKRSGLSFFMCRSADNGAGPVTSQAAVVVEEEKKLEKSEGDEASVGATKPQSSEKKKENESLSSNGAAVMTAEETTLTNFKDSRWVGGTWDLKQFQKDGKTNWDAVIDAEARRRKWLEDNPEASTTDEPVIFDTSIIPWWAWVKRFHLPEAELLNGRAAMIGFFMAYFVDSLTGAGLVDQMGNFFCKTLLFVSVVGVLFIRKNEDIEKLKKLLDETTFYDKQWQATWLEDKTSESATRD